MVVLVLVLVLFMVLVLVLVLLLVLVPPLLVGVRLVGHIRRNILPESSSKLGWKAKSSGCFVFGPFNSEMVKTASAIPAYFTPFSLLRRFGTAFVATTLCQQRSSDCRQHTVRYQQLS